MKQTIYVCIYIYIERERERERDRYMYTYIQPLRYDRAHVGCTPNSRRTHRGIGVGVRPKPIFFLFFEGRTSPGQSGVPESLGQELLMASILTTPLGREHLLTRSCRLHGFLPRDSAVSTGPLRWASSSPWGGSCTASAREP